MFSHKVKTRKMNQISVSKNSLSKDTSILEILFASQIFSSKGQIRRLIEQGAVKVDGVRVDASDHKLNLIPKKKSSSSRLEKKYFKVVS